MWEALIELDVEAAAGPDVPAPPPPYTAAAPQQRTARPATVNHVNVPGTCVDASRLNPRSRIASEF